MSESTSQPTYRARLWSLSKGAGIAIISSGLTVAGVNFFSEKELESVRDQYAREYQIREAQQEFLRGLEELTVEFQGYMAQLASDNSPPLDTAIVANMTDNLRRQQIKIELLKSSIAPENRAIFDEYEDSLLVARSSLMNSKDPGDVHQIFLDVARIIGARMTIEETILGSRLETTN